MKPVGPTNALARIVDDKSLMMLNSATLGIRYMMQLVSSSKTDITTTGGISLPMELWDRILGFALVDKEDSFCLVQGVSLKESSLGRVFHYHKVNLEGGQRCGDLESAEEVHAFEKFMNKLNELNFPNFIIPTIEPFRSPRSTFDILITSEDDNLPIDSACLFSKITVPDVISCMESGACSFCSGDRHICPGCTGGRAQKFDVFMGCGVTLACPLCIGIDFSLRHKTFLQTYYWDDAPEEEQKSIDDWLRHRMEELGYWSQEVWDWPHFTETLQLMGRGAIEL